MRHFINDLPFSSLLGERLKYPQIIKSQVYISKELRVFFSFGRGEYMHQKTEHINHYPLWILQTGSICKGKELWHVVRRSNQPNINQNLQLERIFNWRGCMISTFTSEVDHRDRYDGKGNPEHAVLKLFKISIQRNSISRCQPICLYPYKL